MKLELSQRTKNLKPSPTLAVTALAAKLRAQGKDIIGLGAGEPDFDTPAHIKQAAIKAIESGDTKYTNVDGTDELKQAIISKFQRDNQLSYHANQILVSCGGKHSFYNLCQAILEPGDEAIVPAPYWVSYPPMIELTGAKAVILECGLDQGFKLSPDQLESAITDKSKLLVLNSPSNPTGAVYSIDELKALGEVIKKHPNLLVVSDDIYEAIVWLGQPYTNILSACPELYEQTMILNGVSKTYAMTGWRIGYAAGPAEIIKGMKTIQSQSTSNPTSISQAASVAAIAGDQRCIVPMLDAFKKRHQFVLQGLNKLNGVKCAAAGGAFYLFPSFQEVIKNKGLKNDIELGEWLLDKAGVAVVPGSGFGAEGFARLSFATSDDNLSQALERMERLINS
ncbi:MAG: pyridoxal phosphate-dependent aminotransferase [Gammaproteobacteria bacterium]|nr:pyridoxal phosphate-dependent aminotransferase [Gammaproteobacteria bacterium]MDH5731370.1 pyridoxal phosphate-dependent aminotransferase [Gammaproteobacteria bacterium]